MFDLIENELFAWPAHQSIPEHPTNLIKVACLIRQQKWLDAEADCINILVNSRDSREREIGLWLLCLLFLNSFSPSRAKEVYFHAVSSASLRLPWCYLRFRLYASDSGFYEIEKSFLSAKTILSIQETRFNSSLFSDYFDILNCFSTSTAVPLIQDRLNHFSRKNSLEYVRAYSRFLTVTGRVAEAVRQLSDVETKCADNHGYWIQFCETALVAQDSVLSLHSLRKLYGLLGDHPRVLPLLLQVKLLQRQPSLARRSTFLLRTAKSADLSVLNASTSSANQLTSLEHCGNVEWFPYLLPQFISPSKDRHGDGTANMIYHLSSIESLLSKPLAQAFFDSCAVSSPAFKKDQVIQSVNPPKSVFENGVMPLRVAWVTPDIGPHPVSRFLLSFLSNSDSENTFHTVISTSPNKPDESWLLADFSSLRNVDTAHLPPSSIQGTVDAIRSMSFDVVVDLAGWTGGNFQAGFFNRLAPVQVNYLGYFASTGNPSMDAWLGDEHLFPQPMREWHTESIERLSRCFLAWQPSAHFAEGQLPVTDEPKGPLRFGCFNHNRKLSDATLRVWGQILGKRSDSRLVLKANASSDPDTQALLRRRMIRQGLNPEHVIWLPLARTHEDHLQQYSEVDIALDCFPNGGCTTTCEALWMGAPVITKTGGSYVSRMSTAVLHGACLEDWCAESEEAYIRLAIQQAEDVQYLRNSRDKWRSQVQQSPLGDASDLMRHLEDRFRTLRRNVA
tara:strand:+ start:654 stop:2849 length:2196 start_codon:yes stop_codon:yes gene_type:complete